MSTKTSVDFQKKAISGTTLTLTFGNGAKRECDGSKIPGYATLTGCALDVYTHGLSQKLGDISARYGKARNYAEALKALDHATMNLLKGTFNGGAVPRPEEDFIIAMSRASKIELEEGRAIWAAFTEEMKAAVKISPEVVVNLGELDTERARAALKPEGGGLATMMAAAREALAAKAAPAAKGK